MFIGSARLELSDIGALIDNKRSGDQEDVRLRTGPAFDHVQRGSGPEADFLMLLVSCYLSAHRIVRSHAEEVARVVQDLLVHLERASFLRELLDAGSRHRTDELGNVREPRFRGSSPADGNRLTGTCVL